MKEKLLNKLLLWSISIILLSSCGKPQVEEKSVAFSLSDTMMEKCKFEKVVASDVKNEIRLFGKIEADNNKTSQMYPVIGGLVTSINVGLGDYVKQGQVLATIQSSEVAKYEQERLDAINEVIIAEKNLKVQKDLYSGKLNSDKDVKVAEVELEKAKANLDRINEVYKIYNFKKGSVFPLVAPISGFVISKKININELLLGSESDPLFSIANIDNVWAVAYVNESDISEIKEGYEAVVKTLAFPDSNFHGKVEKIYNVIDPTTKAMKIRIPIPNTGYKLKPDMNCTVSVHFSENRNMLTVPSSAIIFDKSKFWVMVFKDKHNIETREVNVYRQLDNTSYISSGLKEGETIITENSLLVYDMLND